MGIAKRSAAFELFQASTKDRRLEQADEGAVFYSPTLSGKSILPEMENYSLLDQADEGESRGYLAGFARGRRRHVQS